MNGMNAWLSDGRPIGSAVRCQLDVAAWEAGKEPPEDDDARDEHEDHRRRDDLSRELDR